MLRHALVALAAAVAEATAAVAPLASGVVLSAFAVVAIASQADAAHISPIRSIDLVPARRAPGDPRRRPVRRVLWRSSLGRRRCGGRRCGGRRGLLRQLLQQQLLSRRVRATDLPEPGLRLLTRGTNAEHCVRPLLHRSNGGRPGRGRRMSASPPIADLARTLRKLRKGPILLQKSFCPGDQKFCGLQVRFSCKDVRDLIALR